MLAEPLWQSNHNIIYIYIYISNYHAIHILNLSDDVYQLFLNKILEGKE